MKYDSKIVVKWFAEHNIFAIPEHAFFCGRKWRFDFVFPPHKLALEVEGGAWTNGRHTRGSGFIKDMEKYNRAAVMGWRILRCVPDDLCMQETVDMVKEAMKV